MNFLLDRDADGWARKLAEAESRGRRLRDDAHRSQATGALSGDFTWRCAHGRIEGSLTLAPTRPALIQDWELAAIKP